MAKLRIGTRKSKLALRQTDFVISELKKHHPEIECEVVLIQTKGDQVHHKPLRELSDEGKSAFTSELEKDLLEKNIDIAVHSMKDVAGNVRQQDLIFGAFLERISPLDVLITREKFDSISDLPKDFVIGTVSLRRKAGILRLNSNVQVRNLRGNVQTRVAKLHGTHKWSGHTKIDYDGIVMAEAAIQRSGNDLDLSGLNMIKIPASDIIPPAGQGAIGVQCRREDKDTINIISQINHYDTEFEVRTERDFLYEMGGNCHTVIGVYCRKLGGDVRIVAEISEENGNNRFYIEEISGKSTAQKLGANAAKDLKKSIVSEKGIEFLLKNLNVTKS